MRYYKKKEAQVESSYDDGDRIESFLDTMRRSKKGNLYAEWEADVLVFICAWGAGYRWSIKTDEVSIYSNIEFETEEDAAEALLSELERGRYNA